MNVCLWTRSIWEGYGGVLLSPESFSVEEKVATVCIHSPRNKAADWSNSLSWSFSASEHADLPHWLLQTAGKHVISIEKMWPFLIPWNAKELQHMVLLQAKHLLNGCDFNFNTCPSNQFQSLFTWLLGEQFSLKHSKTAALEMAKKLVLVALAYDNCRCPEWAPLAGENE